MATAPHIAIKVGLSRPNLKGSALAGPICHAFPIPASMSHSCATKMPPSLGPV